MAPIGALGINDAKSAKKMEKSGNLSYLVLPLKASIAVVSCHIRLIVVRPTCGYYGELPVQSFCEATCR